MTRLSRSRRFRDYQLNARKFSCDPLWMHKYASKDIHAPSYSIEDEVIARIDGDQEQVDQWKNVCGVDLSFLTERQKEILLLIAEGSTYREAAEILKLKEGTVKKHMLQARKKVIVRRGNVIQLALFCNEE